MPESIRSYFAFILFFINISFPQLSKCYYRYLNFFMIQSYRSKHKTIYLRVVNVLLVLRLSARACAPSGPMSLSWRLCELAKQRSQRWHMFFFSIQRELSAFRTSLLQIINCTAFASFSSFHFQFSSIRAKAQHHHVFSIHDGKHKRIKRGISN